jgi:PKD repeat protein
MTLPAAGNSRTAYLKGVSSSDTDVRITVAANKTPAGGTTYITVAGRKTSSGEYRSKILIAANGAVSVQLVRSNSGGTETSIAGPVTVAGLTYTANMVLQIRLQVTGVSSTTVRAKVWNNAGTEPGSWLVSTTDNTNGLQTAGSVGLIGYLSSATTNAPVTLTFDNLSATSSTVNQPPNAAFTTNVSGASVTVDAAGSSDPDGTIASYAWNFGDGGTSTGSNSSHTYTSSGSYPITLTVTDNNGATNSTAHTVTVTVPANQPPSAAFTSSVFGATVSLDGTSSSDPDGTVASYAWDFGDGATGSGSTTSHLYAAAGTYTVTLTVTDNNGATNSVSHAVTTTVAGGFAADNFSRTVSSGWGSADLGGSWTLSAPSSFAVNGSAGVMTIPSAGNSRTAYLNGVSSSSTDVQVSAALNKMPTSSTYVTLVGRSVSGGGDYRMKLLLNSSGGVTLILVRTNSAGTETTLSSTAISGLTYAANMVLQLRMQVYGASPTTIKAKAWNSAVSEPSSWMATTTDSTAALQTGGGIGLIGYLASSTTNAPVAIIFDALRATAVA